ncbi:hypothetical protein N9A76_03760, partial [Mariniblastus sp.]|nr:hypothetical protein [Mariniblastus sp.]
ISYQSPHQRSGFFEFANSLALSMHQKFRARCHWGKYNPLDQSANKDLYPRLEEFQEIAKRYDPEAQFANHWLKNTILNDQPIDS